MEYVYPEKTCVFCDIIADDSKTSMVYEDKTVIVIMDIRPINPGHLLVIPKKHFPYLKDMDEKTGQHLFKITHRMAEAVKNSGVKCEGVNLFLADGEAAFQEIFHLHMHVFPRFKGDDFGFTASWQLKPSRKEMDRIAEKIRTAYESQS